MSEPNILVASKAQQCAPNSRYLFVFAALIGLAVFALGAAFGAGYPFVISGDGNGYFELIKRSASSTLFQSGYPLIFIWTEPFAGLVKLPLASVLRFSQYGLAALIAILFFVASSRLIGRVASALCIGFIFLNQNIWVALQTTRPEWLVGLLGLATLSVFILFVVEGKAATRLTLSLILGLLIGTGYIVKVNFITFGVLIVVAFFWERFAVASISPSWKRSSYMLAASAAGFVIIYAPYIAFFHLPKTHGESWLKITYQQGWNTTMHLAEWKGEVSAETGVQSARLVLLNQALPFPPHVGFGDLGWEDIARERTATASRGTKKQRAMIAKVMSAGHRKLLRVIDRSGLSRTLSLDSPTRVILATDYYLGLPEGDRLQVGAFLEAVAKNPTEFMRKIASVTIEFLALRGLPLSTEPLNDASTSSCKLPPTGADYTLQDIAACTDQNSRVLWITARATPDRMSLAIAFRIAAITLLVALLVPARRELKALMLAAFSVCLVQAVFGALVFDSPRSKETYAIFPVYLAFIAFSLSWLAGVPRAILTHVAKPRVGLPTK